MSIVHTSLFTSSLIIVPSRVFRMCGFFSSNTTMFPTRTTFCIEMKRFDNTRTSEWYASLNAFVCLEWNGLFTQVSDLFTFRCHKSQWWCFAVFLHVENISFKHDKCPGQLDRNPWLKNKEAFRSHPLPVALANDFLSVRIFSRFLDSIVVATCVETQSSNFVCHRSAESPLARLLMFTFFQENTLTLQQELHHCQVFLRGHDRHLHRKGVHIWFLWHCNNTLFKRSVLFYQKSNMP